MPTSISLSWELTLPPIPCTLAFQEDQRRNLKHETSKNQGGVFGYYDVHVWIFMHFFCVVTSSALGKNPNYLMFYIMFTRFYRCKMLNQDPRRDLADDLGGLVFWFICKFLRKDVSPNFLGIPLDTFDRGRPGDFFFVGEL